MRTDDTVSIYANLLPCSWAHGCKTTDRFILRELTYTNIKLYKQLSKLYSAFCNRLANKSITFLYIPSLSVSQRAGINVLKLINNQNIIVK